MSALVLAFSASGPRQLLPGQAVRTLSSLVPAVIEGTVRDVTLVTGESATDLAQIADHAGCTLIAAETEAAALKTALTHCRSRDVLIVTAGVAFDRTLLDELSGLLPVFGLEDQPLPRVLLASHDSFLQRVLPFRAKVVGLLGRKERLLHSGSSRLQDLARRTKPTRPFRTRVLA